ncbi:MAG: right-handed parallel beta-helix repeat-containing protein [Flavobacteriales bacterium]|nr:right-handed parallel beta-helix repeat-containing protein [Flavobacteriales bacterium]
MIGFTPPSTAQCFTSQDSVSFNISVADLATWAADQIIDFDFTPKTTVNPTLCAAQNITFKLEYPPVTGPDDAAVLRIDSPDVFCPSVQNIYATVGNAGTNQINSLTINWELDGNVQTPVSYTSLLDTLGGAGSTSALVLLGSYNFGASPVSIKVYTSNPNGVADTDNLNDTALVIKQASLSGNLTIDPALAASGVNYTSFSSLAATLNRFGVCGPVLVTVASGTYNESFSLLNVVGASSVNTITIDGVDSSLVTLTHDGATSYGTVSIVGTDYVTVRNMRIEATGAASGATVLMSNDASHTTIENNELWANPTTTNSFMLNVTISGSSTTRATNGIGSHNTVQNNKMTGGYYGFYYYGAAVSDGNIGNIIHNNEMDSIYCYGVFAYYQDSLTMTNNSIDQATRGQTNGDGLYLYYSSNFEVKANYVHAYDYGMYFYNFANVGTPAKTRKALVANNMVISESDFGMYFLYADSLDVFYNSIRTNGTTNPAVQITANATNLIDDYDFRNNILSSANTQALEITGTTDTIFSKLDNNVYFSGGANLITISGTNYVDLATYQLAQTTYNTASLEGDPQFASATDLHIFGSFVDGAGDNSVLITVDIDGDSRPIAGSTTVDPGADEYNPPLCPPISGLTVINITADSLTAFWMGSGNTYEYSIVPAGTTVGGGITGMTPLDSIRIGMLMSGAFYDVYVREICGRGDTSTWDGPVQVTTPCTTPNPVVLPYFQDFESFSGTIVGDGLINCTTGANWNFETTSQTDGRAHYGTNAIGVMSGNGHLTLDEVQNNQPQNRAILTLNMSNYPTNGLELSFDYFDHGDENHAGDNVWVRGSELDPWVLIYALLPGGTANGVINSVGPLDIDAVLIAAGQTVTSTFQVALGQEDNSAATSQTGIDGISFDNVRVGVLSPFDAGVTEVVSPQLPICPGTTIPIINVQNYGTDTLVSFQVFWSVNGVLDSLLYTGQVLPDSSTLVTLNNVTFVAGVAYNFVIYTKNLNGGVTDGDPTNDTLSIAGLETGLAGGTYTIDSATVTGGSNFQSFTDFVDAVNNFGLCGPIVVDVVAGSGPYNEQIVFDGIEGTNGTNTIVINGNGNTLAFASTTSINRAVITFDDVSWITIDSLRIDAIGATYGWGTHLTNGTHHIEVLNSEIFTDLVSTSSVNFSCIVITGSPTSTSTQSDVEYVTVDNCLLSGGYYGITARGTSGNNSRDFIFTNNTVEDNHSSGIYIQYGDNALVEDNEMTRPNKTNTTTYYGVYFVTNVTNSTINANVVHNTHDQMTSTSATYPIAVSGDVAVGEENYVTNNLIYNINSNGTIYGIYDLGANGTYYYNNTISLDHTTATAGITRGFYQSSASSNSGFFNNIITVSRGGSGIKNGIHLNNATTTISVDYNNVFMSSAGTGAQNYGRLGTADQATLADWQLNTIYGANSFAVTPNYVDITLDDYMPQQALINAVALSVPQVTTDLFGVARGTNPDFGAIEFDPPPVDNVGLNALVAPIESNDSCFGVSHDVIVELLNAGGTVIDFATSITDITINVTGAITQTLTTTVNSNVANGGNPLALGTSVNINVGTINMSTPGAYNFDGYIVTVNDSIRSNDTLNAVITTLTPAGGMIAGSDTICLGDTVTLSATNTIGQLQWQVLNGGSWTNIMNATGENLDIFPTVLTEYRVLACGTAPSDTISVTPLVVAAPVAFGDTVIVTCGDSGIANGYIFMPDPNLTYTWYDAATGGNEIVNGGGVTVNAAGDTIAFKATPAGTASPNTYTAWVTAVTSGGAGGPSLVITEMDLGGPDALEIQNVSNGAVDVTGWTVAISNNYTNINLVNVITQPLTGLMAPGQVTYWTDAAATNYWGNNILWNPGAFPGFAGWILIIDNNGDIVDFMAQGWLAADIAGMSVVINGFTITPGLSGAWVGDGVSGVGLPTGSSLYRQGNADNNDATDFIQNAINLGTTNTGLTLPFAGGGCESPRVMVNLKVECLVGLEGLTEETVSLSISPNPSNGLFTLNIETPQQEQFNVIVRNTQGQLVHEQILTVNGQHNEQFDFKSFSKGVYFIVLQNDAGSWVEKLVIQ